MTRNIVLTAIALSMCLAIFVSFVSNGLHPRFEHRNESIAQQRSILDGTANTQYPLDGKPSSMRGVQSRVLFPIILFSAAPVFNRAFHLSLSQTYLSLRLLFAFIMFISASFVLYSLSGRDIRASIAGVSMLAYELIFTFSHGWDHPEDYPDVALTMWLIYGTCKKWRLASLILCLVMSANRETSIFAGPLWIAAHGLLGSKGRAGFSRFAAREILYGIALTLFGYAAPVVIRFALAGPSPMIDTYSVAGSQIVGNIQMAVRSFNPSSWPLLLAAMLAPIVLWLHYNWGYASGSDVLMTAVAVLGIAVAVTANIGELRDYTTGVIIALTVATVLEARRRKVQGSQAGVVVGGAGLVQGGGVLP